MGVRDSLPIEGISFLLGNDIAGDLVVPDPVVCPEPLSDNPTADLEKKFTGLFPSCAVTRSMAKIEEEDNVGSLGLDCLFPESSGAQLDTSSMSEDKDLAKGSDVKLNVSKEKLYKYQS